jgi:ketosteroid isomerase-like protein
MDITRGEVDMIGALLARRGLAAAFHALNGHELERFMAAWRDDGVFEFPGDIPESGRFEGRAAVESWFRRFFEQYPTIEFSVRDICVRSLLDMMGTNVVAVRWDLRLVNRADHHGSNSGVTVVTLTRGKVVHARDYIFDLGDDFRRNWGVLMPAAATTLAAGAARGDVPDRT